MLNRMIKYEGIALDAWNVYYSAPIDWMSTYQIVKLYEELVRVKCIHEIQEENHVT